MAKRIVTKKLVDAPEDKSFWVNGGPVLRNLRELENALKMGSITEAQFKYHTGRGKNDFSAWIGSILNDDICAKALARVKTRKTALRVLSEYLKHYN